MATNDVNLQVINSMTQEKMNSLKDSSGKIPSLANQIIMTDEEDANLGYKLYAHHLYLVSSNTRIWVTITTETEDVFTQSTFHKWLYDKGFNGTTSNTNGNWLSVNGGFRSEKTNISAIASNNSTSGDFVIIATTSSGTTPTAITVTEFSDMVKLINPQPAMIYTGAELHEGDGISIENGVISGISIKELWKNPDTSSYFVATTITLNSDDYDFLLIIWGSNRTDILYENSCIVKKGNNIAMNGVICSSSSPYIYVVNRFAVRNNDTSYTFDECYQSTPSGTNTANHRLIPKYIYGIKVV